MQVNENYYGRKEYWHPATTISQTNTPEAEKIKMANFLEASESSVTQDNRNGVILGNLIYKAEELDTSLKDIIYDNVLDRSVTFVGIAGDSPYTKIRYYSNRQTGASPRLIVEEGEEEFDIYNTAFSIGGYTEFGNNCKYWTSLYNSDNHYTSGGSNFSGASFRWTPMKINKGLRSGSYPYYYLSGGNPSATRNDIKIVTQLPVKRIIWIPYLTAATSNMQQIITVDLDTYLSAYKTSRPMILSISMGMVFEDGTSRTNQSGSLGLLSLTKHSLFNGIWAGQPAENNCVEITSEHGYNCPQILSSPYIPLGGYINNGHGTSQLPNGFRTNNENYSIDIMAVIDCGDIKFNKWSDGDGIITASTPPRIYADASEYTDDEIKESCFRAIACFGMFFTSSLNNALTLPLDDNDMFLGTLVNGVGYGDYTRGVQNRAQPQWNWSTMDENTYDPENPPAPPAEDLWSDFAYPPFTINKGYLPNHWYLFPTATLENIFKAINLVDLTTLDKNATYGLNPIDGILQIKRIYMNLSEALNFLDEHSFVGGIDIGLLQLYVDGGIANAIASVNKNGAYTYVCGDHIPVSEPSEYRDFRSYSPYASCAFYDAFCGITEIDPAKILNKYITVTQTVDFLSGDKITSIYASESTVDLGERVATLTGNCSEDVPINGLATADYQRNKYVLTNQLNAGMYKTLAKGLMGAGGASISAISENPVGAITQGLGTFANLAAGYYEMETNKYLAEHITPSASKISNGSSNVESGVIFPPTLFLYLPKMNENYDNLLYSKNIGFSGYAHVKPKELSQGSHVFSHPRVSITGTKREQYMLLDQLQKGFYIK